MGCKHEGCNNVRLAQGLCNKHYIQYRKKGIIKKLPPAISKECVISNCSRKVMAHDLCARHYNFYRRRGDTTMLPPSSIKRCTFSDCHLSVIALGLCHKHYGHMKKGKLGITKERERHGMEGTPEYEIWKAMKKRCLNPHDASYKNYGGRGIEVAERWLKFSNFYADMGQRPSPELTIERKDNDGNYEPGNCKWATRYEQALNQRYRRVNSSGHRNITWHKQSKKWRVRVTREGRKTYLGRFDILINAIKARDDFLVRYNDTHGN